MSKRIKVYRVEMKPDAEEVEIDESDLITIQAAADLRGVSIPSITSMMDTGRLPVFQLMTYAPAGGRIQRYTSKKAVMNLGPKVGRGNQKSSSTQQQVLYKRANTGSPRLVLSQ